MPAVITIEAIQSNKGPRFIASTTDPEGGPNMVAAAKTPHKAIKRLVATLQWCDFNWDNWACEDMPCKSIAEANAEADSKTKKRRGK